MINLDSNNGPGTHWVCNVDSFYFDPFGLSPPENIIFINRYNTLQYQKKKRYLFFVVTFVFVFIKNSKMVIQFTTFCSPKTQVKMKQF